MNSHAARARLDQLHDEVRARYQNNTITKSYMDAVEAEAEQLGVQIRTASKAASFASFASPGEYGMSNVNPGDASGYSFASRAASKP